MLRKLLDGRLVFTPTTATDGTRVYQFTGRGVLDPIVAGMIPTLLNNSNNIKRWWPQGAPIAGPFSVRLPVGGTLTLKAA